MIHTSAAPVVTASAGLGMIWYASTVVDACPFFLCTNVKGLSSFRRRVGHTRYPQGTIFCIYLRLLIFDSGKAEYRYVPGTRVAHKARS